ncbi:ankyrin repeat protein (macronuclear) [Tetrahymena thermophila SB210]|uniref:Ankyrin repeat protein n=1 Tax=Tetrahymena thermophila (strain SB210) TaxID=312017 RepID=Q22VX2_TETTS|nr:ankyrin repeat protein [Tetrahymena thermophila SB210]EAR89644.1 ankyrin repeat protein [Tetrahymena thermophila SB210]|eukprot:XP_001009890.1 ankyrin repeat protein [Tetrahymena thermophila SB210]
MSKKEDTTLQQQLKNLSQNELIDLTKIAIKSDNVVLLKLIDKQKKSIMQTNSPFANNSENIFNICKYGSSDLFNYFSDKKYDFSIKDTATGNKCQHFASIYGNLQVLNELIKRKNIFNMNDQNNKQETALHVALKYGQYRYEKTTMLLTRFTDLTLKDSELKEPHRIRMKNFKQNVRLSEFLHQKYIKQKQRQQNQFFQQLDQNESNQKQ